MRATAAASRDAHLLFSQRRIDLAMRTVEEDILAAAGPPTRPATARPLRGYPSNAPVATTIPTLWNFHTASDAR